MQKTLRTYVYIDGFNFYYGSLKGSRYKWLNPELLCKNILSPQNQIESIKYFTASVSARSDDPQMPIRQDIYFRALKTITCLKIIKGHYLTHNKNMKLANPPLYRKVTHPISGEVRYHAFEFVDVLNTEEKGSDVNLATNLLIDAFEDKFDVAVVISNDSDLATPVGLVKNKFKKSVLILNPHSLDKKSIQLTKYSTKVIQIEESHLVKSLFNEQLTDSNGSFVKPDRW